MARGDRWRQWGFNTVVIFDFVSLLVVKVLFYMPDIQVIDGVSVFDRFQLSKMKNK